MKPGQESKEKNQSKNKKTTCHQTMALELHDEWAYFLCTISWIVSFISAMICMYGTFKAIDYLNKIENGSKNRTQITLIILTISCMWVFTMCNICDSIGFPYWSGLSESEKAYEHSSNSYMMWNVFWCSGKLLQYILYCGRLYSVFRGTKYATGSYMYIIIIILLLAQFSILIAWVWYYNIRCIVDPLNCWPHDIYQTLTILAWLIAVIDMVLTLIIIALFLSSMKRLMATVSKYMMTAELSGTAAGNLELGTRNRGGSETYDIYKYIYINILLLLYILFWICSIKTIHIQSN